MHAKDGTSREVECDGTNRPRNFRTLVASLALAAGTGALLAACGLALSPRRKPRPSANTTTTDTLLQQLTRYRAADGTHSIHGTLLAEFEPGDRIATLHIAFCPPFERLPAVDAETIGSSDATVKMTQILHNGVQLEVRLSEPSDDERAVTVEMLATDSAPA